MHVKINGLTSLNLLGLMATKTIYRIIVSELKWKIICIYAHIRLIRHTEKLLEEKEEKLCVKVLRTLREMMAVDPEYGEKV